MTRRKLVAPTRKKFDLKFQTETLPRAVLSGNFEVVRYAGRLHVEAPASLGLSFRCFSYNGPVVG